MENVETYQFDDWVKHELVPALSAIGNIDPSVECEIWKQGMLSGIALVSAQLQMEQSFTANELLASVFFAWLADREKTGVCDD